MLRRKIVNVDRSGVRHRLVGNVLGKHAVRVLSALFAIKTRMRSNSEAKRSASSRVVNERRHASLGRLRPSSSASHLTTLAAHLTTLVCGYVELNRSAASIGKGDSDFRTLAVLNLFPR
jgi:hypothetical protein